MNTLSTGALALIPSKFRAGLLSFVLVLAASAQATFAGDGWTAVTGWQFVGVALAAAATYIFPLTQGPWPAALKTLGAVAGAVVAAIPPVIDTANGGAGWNGETIMLVALAGLNALASEWGVSQRLAATKAAVVSEEIPDAEIVALDPAAYRIVKTELSSR